MPNLSNRKMAEKLTVVIKGEPGSGKTIAASSFPKPIYYFDLDGRMDPLINYYRKTPDVLASIDYDTYTNRQFNDFYTKMNDLERSCKYGTVVIDSLTSLADAIIMYGIKLRGVDTARKTQKGVIALPEIEDYGVENRALTEIVDFLRGLPCHVILNAHVISTFTKDIKNPGSVQVTRSLLTAGQKVAAKLPGYFNEVWHAYVDADLDVSKPPRFLIRTQNTGVDFAKTALPLPAKIDFTNKSLFDEVMGILAKEGINLQTTTPKVEPKKDGWG